MNLDTTRVPSRLYQPELVTALIVFLFLAVVEFGVANGYIDPLVLQKPTAVFDNLITALGTREIQLDFLVTAERVGIASFISIILGSLASILLWQYEVLRKAYLPLLGAIFATPIPLLYLVFIVLFGRGTTAIVAISVPLGAIPIAINATDALSSVEDVKIRVARSFNASKYQVLYKVIIPDAAPEIFTGIRIGFSYIVITVTAIEFLLVTNGLGGYVSDEYFKFNTSNMFVGITLIILIVIVAIFILQRVEEMIKR